MGSIYPHNCGIRIDNMSYLKCSLNKGHYHNNFLGRFSTFIQSLFHKENMTEDPAPSPCDRDTVTVDPDEVSILIDES